MDATTQTMIDGVVEMHGASDELYAVIEQLAEQRAQILLAAIGACVDEETWKRVELAVERARNF